MKFNLVLKEIDVRKIVYSVTLLTVAMLWAMEEKEEARSLKKELPGLNVEIDLNEKGPISQSPLKESEEIAVVKFKIDGKDFYRPYDAGFLSGWLEGKPQPHCDVMSQAPISRIFFYENKGAPDYRLVKKVVPVRLDGKELAIDENGFLDIYDVVFGENELEILNDFFIDHKDEIRGLRFVGCGTPGKVALDIPSAIGELENLESFSVLGMVGTIPSEIGKLKDLRVLKFPSAKLSVLPNEIGDLESLEIFDLSGNYLSSLPEEIKYLNNLKRLDLRGNHLPYKLEIDRVEVLQ